MLFVFLNLTTLRLREVGTELKETYTVEGYDKALAQKLPNEIVLPVADVMDVLQEAAGDLALHQAFGPDPTVEEDDDLDVRMKHFFE